MKIYALTGGIGAGKSAASKRFAERGIPVIDSDALGHEVIEPGAPAFQAVVDRFGEGILKEGQIDRPALGEIVFSDPKALQDLNAIVHPAVIAETGRLSAEYAAQGHTAIIIEAALHAEDGTLREPFEALILVDCPEEIRIQRLVENRQMAPEEAQSRIKNQTPPEKKKSLARWIIQNDKSMVDLTRQVDAIVPEL